MEQGEVAGLETPGFEQDHGEGIAEDQHDGAAAGGGEIEGAGFALDADVEDQIGGLGEGALEATGEGDQAAPL
jgi:hypothetical protein